MSGRGSHMAPRLSIQTEPQDRRSSAASMAWVTGGTGKASRQMELTENEERGGLARARRDGRARVIALSAREECRAGQPTRFRSTCW